MSDPTTQRSNPSTDAVLQSYETGQRNFQGLELNGVQWAGVNLKGADFSYADLSEANLAGANLRGADLSFARLTEANLEGADLRGSSLIGTDLRNARLDHANLIDADYDPETTHFPVGFQPQVEHLKSDHPELQP